MLDNVTYFSASAGSGKTYTLTHELADLIANGTVEPEKVILTTYTRVAAAEFREKAKAALYEKGLFDAATRLDSAKIGTVHSVAESLIHKFWYHLGVSPDFQIMSDENKDFYVDQSLVTIATEAEKAVFNEYTRRFDLRDNFKAYNYEFWKSPLKKLIEYATNYCITDFTKSRAKSIEAIKNVFMGTDSLDIDPAYVKGCLKDLQAKLLLTKESGARQKRLGVINDWLDKLDNDKPLALADFTQLSSMLVLPKSFDKDSNVAALKAYVPDIWQSKEVQSQFVDYVNALFDIAGRWQNEFAEYKRQKHLVDFNDLEKLMLDLLNIDEVVEDIKAEFDYLFVDEFQDSSPMQVAIFTRLSQMVKKCIWVGDYKQAIYGFRGADTELIKSVVNTISDVKTLDTSHRSVKSLVELSNQFFEKPFAAEGLTKDKVCLNPHRPDIAGSAFLRYWDTNGNKQERCKQIAAQLAREVKADPEHLNDIAVLAKKNDDLDGVAKALASYGIPVNRETGNVAESMQWILLKSLLAVAVNPSDALARATVAYLSEPGYGAGKLIDEKLIVDDYNSKRSAGDSWKNYLADVPLLKTLDAMSKALEHQSVHAVVETLVVELNLCKVTAHMEGDSSVIYHSIIDAATTYETLCLGMSLPATIYGFNEWINGAGLKIGGDVHGVNFYTIHKSKGLEWKKVVLLFLDSSFDDNSVIKHSYLGVQLRKEPGFSVDTMGDSTFVRIMPQPFAGNANVAESVLANVGADPEYDSYIQREISEGLRVMYVAVTRAAEQLVLEKKACDTPFAALIGVGIENADDVVSAMAKADNSAEDIQGYQFNKKDEFLPKLDNNPNQAYEPRDILPSSTYGTVVGTVTEALPLADETVRIPVEWSKLDPSDMNKVGTCIHNIFATLDQQDDPKAFASNMIQSQDMETYLPLATAAAKIVESWNRLTDYLTKTYGESVKVYHELPFHYLHEGKIVKGSMDFVWQTANGAVLIDFKNLFIGTDKTCLDPSADHYLGKYKGQFDCYQQVLKAHGETVLDRLIYMPITGRAVKI